MRVKALATVRADLERTRQLVSQNFVSKQALERGVLAERETLTRLDAANSRLALARNASSYARLSAPTGGVLIDVSAELGQVVAAGQPLATLARDGEQEVEVFFPEQVRPPAAGRLVRPDATSAPLRLREAAGAVDPQSRTWRARYTVVQSGQPLALGSVVRTAFETPGAPSTALRVPMAAIDERGSGPRVWHVVKGLAQPVPVEIVSVDTEAAQIRGNLKVGEKVIALGTHLLAPGMAVQELAR